MAEKFKVAMRQKLKCVCSLCNGNKNLPEDFDLDHIVPLWSSGSNKLDNIQAICPNGHRKKTSQEMRMYYSRNRAVKYEKMKTIRLIPEDELKIVDQFINNLRRKKRQRKIDIKKGLASKYFMYP